MPQISSKKLVGGILQFLIAIPVVLYICFALLTLLILIFFIVPVVIPIATKIWYLDYVRSTLREVSRSPFYVSLVSTAFSMGVLLFCGCVVGRRKQGREFVYAVEGEDIRLIGRDLLVPYPKKMRVRDNYYHTYYKHRGILVLAETQLKYYRRPKPPAFPSLIGLAAIVLISMLIKDYFVLKGINGDIFPLLNAVADLLLLWGALVVGFFLGKEIIQAKISCKWGKGASGDFTGANIVAGYLCSRSVLASGSYVVIYHLVDVDEISFHEAEDVYLKFKSMSDSKFDLSEWSKTE